jgi:hypothetical protein
MATEVKVEVPVGADGQLIAGRPRMSWGAIFGGVFTALGLWLLLYTFGLAVGLSTIDPHDAGSLKGSGVFTGIWGAITPLVALFFGGWVAARGSGVRGRAEGALHGLVMWGLATVGGAYFALMLVSMVIGGVASVGKAAVQAGGAAVVGAVGAGTQAGSLAQSFGLDADDALRPINQRLRAAGKPAVTADELQTATKDVVQSAVRQGHLDRDMLVQAIAQNTSLTRADAADVADRVQAQWTERREQLGNRLQSAAASAGTGALQAAEATGKVFWGVFGALLLGLIAALAGGIVGVPGQKHERPRREREPAPVAPPREVYP